MPIVAIAAGAGGGVAVIVLSKSYNEVGFINDVIYYF